MERRMRKGRCGAMNGPMAIAMAVDLPSYGIRPATSHRRAFCIHGVLAPVDHQITDQGDIAGGDFREVLGDDADEGRRQRIQDPFGENGRRESSCCDGDVGRY